MHPATFSLLRILGDGMARDPMACARDAGVAKDEIGDLMRSLAMVDTGGRLKMDGGQVQLRAPIDWLDTARIRQMIDDAGCMASIEVLNTADSTNAALAGRECASGQVITCEWQSGGRGRRGRAWSAPLGASLAFSMAWNFRADPVALAGLPLAVGVAVVRGLEQAGITGVGLKWPNDLLGTEGKLGGILVEARVVTDREPRQRVVIGVGLNVALDPETRRRVAAFATQGAAAPAALPPPQAVTDLATHSGARPDRSLVLGHVVVALAEGMSAFERDGFAGTREAWNALHRYRDRVVEVTGTGTERCSGRAVEAAPDGALLIATAQGIRAIHAGDVSVRPADAASLAIAGRP